MYASEVAGPFGSRLRLYREFAQRMLAIAQAQPPGGAWGYNIQLNIGMAIVVAIVVGGGGVVVGGAAVAVAVASARVTARVSFNSKCIK